MERGELRGVECTVSNVRDRGWQLERGELRVAECSVSNVRDRGWQVEGCELRGVECSVSNVRDRGWQVEGGELRVVECMVSNVRDRGWQVERGELRVVECLVSNVRDRGWQIEGGELRVDECTGEYSLCCERAEVDELRGRSLPEDRRPIEGKEHAHLFVAPQPNDLQEGFAGEANVAKFVASDPIEHQQEAKQVVPEREEGRHSFPCQDTPILLCPRLEQ